MRYHIRTFSSLALFLFGIFLFQSCSNIANKNYQECRPSLEESRLENQKKQSYSYDPKTYNDCRRPSRVFVEDMQPD